MGVRISKNKTLPIGVDLGTSSAKLAQFRINGNDFELVGSEVLGIPDSARDDPQGRLGFLGSALKKAIRSGLFRGSQCVLSLPAAETFVHHVRIPKVPPGELESAVLKELEGKLPFGGKQTLTRHVITGDVFGAGEPKQEVLTVSCARETLSAYLAMASKARADVTCVNVEACAVVECFSRLFRRQDDQKRTILYVDIGSNSSQVVLSHGPKIVFARNLHIGGRAFDQALAEAKDISLAEASQARGQKAHESLDPEVQQEYLGQLAAPIQVLGDELTQCLRYYESVFRNHSVERAIFVGGEANDKPLCQAIAKRLNLPAQIGDPMARVRLPESSKQASGPDHRPQPQWAVAVGLGLGAA